MIYHDFTIDTGFAQRKAIVAVATPYHVDEYVSSAKRSGKARFLTTNPDFSIYQNNVVELDIGGSLTFDDIQVPAADSYFLCIDGNDNSNGGSTGTIIDITINGKLYKQLDTQHSDFGGSSSLIYALAMKLFN